MSERSALGTFQEISGSRTNAIGDSSRRFIAPTIFCWRRARVRSSSLLVAGVLAGARQRQRLLAVDVRLAGRQAQRVAAVLEAAVDLRDDAAAAVRDAAHRVDERREVLEADDHHVVDVDAGVLLDRLHGQRRAADRVGGVDLLAPGAGDVDDRVARDRQAAVRAAADAHEQDRVRAPVAGRLRARLGGVARAHVGAEHEDVVRRRGGIAGAAEQAVGVGDLALLDLRADEEDEDRQRDPGDDREQDPADDAAAREALATRRGRRLRDQPAAALALGLGARRAALAGVLGALGARAQAGELVAIVAAALGKQRLARAVDAVVGPAVGLRAWITRSSRRIPAADHGPAPIGGFRRGRPAVRRRSILGRAGGRDSSTIIG